MGNISLIIIKGSLGSQAESSAMAGDPLNLIWIIPAKEYMLKIKTPPQWGITPVAKKNRLLSVFDFFILWSSLGVGLLVLEAGALLVPGLGFLQAILAIFLGSLIGVFLLSLTGMVGSDHGIPTMVSLRSVLGIRGSYLATIFNIAQLIGWTAFELWVMAVAANQITKVVFGFSNYWGWVIVFGLWSMLLSLGGPLMVVRVYLEKFGIWLVYGVTVFITYQLFTNYDILSFIGKSGSGSLPFFLALDLVIAMPISWMPLVADYNRFARQSTSAFAGTFLGYLLSNVWFYSLGAILLLAFAMERATPENLATSIMALTGGVLALLVILVDETDNAFADIYSAAVSLQNIFPKVSQTFFIILITLIGMTLAAFLTMGKYFTFLLLIGSVFVPLFGVFAAHYFILLRRSIKVSDLYKDQGKYYFQKGVNLKAVLAWVMGISLYHLIAQFFPVLGASLPSFLASFLGYLLFAKL